MKKLFLIAALAFSLNLFGQNNPVIDKSNIQGLNFIKNNRVEPFTKDTKNFGRSSKKHPAIPIRNQAQTQRGLIPVYDSIYQWSWDDSGPMWNIDYRIINIVYDANNYPTSYI